MRQIITCIIKIKICVFPCTYISPNNIKIVPARVRVELITNLATIFPIVNIQAMKIVGYIKLGKFLLNMHFGGYRSP